MVVNFGVFYDINRFEVHFFFFNIPISRNIPEISSITSVIELRNGPIIRTVVGSARHPIFNSDNLNRTVRARLHTVRYRGDELFGAPDRTRR